MKPIKTIACVGSGLIGQGWATLFSSKDYKLILYDLNSESLEFAMQQISTHLEFLETHDLLQPGCAQQALNQITVTDNLAEAVTEADYVQESAYDNYEVKKRLFREMDQLASSDTILASSSSGLLMSEIQTAVARPERCVLAHPFLPVHLLPLVEVVGGEQTASETVERTCQLMENIGKIPVRLKKEISGYIVNRLQAAVLREAVDLVANGVAEAEEVDRAFCNGMGMRDPFIGPLLRAHLAGNGIENFVANFTASYHLRWESMATWESISPSVRDTLVNSVNTMPTVRENSLEEIKNWRDKMLMEILKLNRTCC